MYRLPAAITSASEVVAEGGMAKGEEIAIEAAVVVGVTKGAQAAVVAMIGRAEGRRRKSADIAATVAIAKSDRVMTIDAGMKLPSDHRGNLDDMIGTRIGMNLGSSRPRLREISRFPMTKIGEVWKKRELCRSSMKMIWLSQQIVAARKRPAPRGGDAGAVGAAA
jgi:hypothetical protein